MDAPGKLRGEGHIGCGASAVLEAGATALHKAALLGNPDVAALLLDHGAFIDQQVPILGHTALMDAVVYKHDAVVRLLLDRGARTSIRNHWDETALDLARRDGLDRIVGMIEARNAADRAAMPAQPLAAPVKQGDLVEVERLIAAGAGHRLDLRTHAGLTPRELAAHYGYDALARLLAEAEQASQSPAVSPPTPNMSNAAG